MENNSTKYTFIDLCAGIGAFHQALKPYGNCILASDIDRFSKISYLSNYSTMSWEDDLKNIVPNNLPKFDIICAGFPCQAFSLAGKKLGFEDARGTIFFDIAKIMESKKPKIFLMENVKNLINHDQKKTFKVILNTLDQLGYYCHHFLFNAQYFVPQRRERIYMVGVSKDVCSRDEFDLLCANILSEYELKKKTKLPNIIDILEQNPESKYTISNKLWEFLQQHAKKHQSKGNGFGYGLVDPKNDINTRTLTARYHKDGSEVLIKQENKNPRKLTPRECARLMGFPDDYLIAVSDTQAYKQFGNSIVVPVVKMIVNQVMNSAKNWKK